MVKFTSRRRAALVAAVATLLLPALLVAGRGGAAFAANYTERQGHHGANTFTNYHNASGQGPSIAAMSSVDVSCKVYDPTIASVNPDGYWYRIATSPWNNAYYAAANTFFNGDPINGPYTHNTDFNVPDCSSSPPPTPTVVLAQGPAAPAGYRYAITLTGFPANTSVALNCYDSVSPGGFYPFSLTTNGSGSAFTQSYCYSGDGPDHWVVAAGHESNHVQWGGSTGGGGGTGGGGTGGGGTGGGGTGGGGTGGGGTGGATCDRSRVHVVSAFPLPACLVNGKLTLTNTFRHLVLQVGPTGSTSLSRRTPTTSANFTSMVVASMTSTTVLPPGYTATFNVGSGAGRVKLTMPPNANLDELVGAILSPLIPGEPVGQLDHISDAFGKIADASATLSACEAHSNRVKNALCEARYRVSATAALTVMCAQLGWTWLIQALHHSKAEILRLVAGIVDALTEGVAASLFADGSVKEIAQLVKGEPVVNGKVDVEVQLSAG